MSFTRVKQTTGIALSYLVLWPMVHYSARRLVEHTFARIEWFWVEIFAAFIFVGFVFLLWHLPAALLAWCLLPERARRFFPLLCVLLALIITGCLRGLCQRGLADEDITSRLTACLIASVVTGWAVGYLMAWERQSPKEPPESAALAAVLLACGILFSYHVFPGQYIYSGSGEFRKNWLTGQWERCSIRGDVCVDWHAVPDK